MKGPLAALTSCALVLVMLVAIDASMRWWRAATSAVTTRSVEYIVPNDALGWVALPSTNARVVKADGDRVVYDVVYSFDEHGRRIVPQDPNAQYEKFLLFFGDSGTFGEGIDARDSIPVVTASRLAGVRAYNYAFHGYGPQHVLAKVETTDLRSEVAEPKGLALYLVSDFLIERLVGGSHILAWASRLPYYTIDDGGVRRDGFFQTARPIRSWLLKLIGGSPLIERLNVRWRWHTTDADRELFCRVMAAARDGIRRQLSGTDLLVVLHPNDPVAPLPCLERYGLRVIDLRGAFGERPEAELKIPGDLHPTPLADELVAAALARELQPLLRAQDERAP